MELNLRYFVRYKMFLHKIYEIVYYIIRIKSAYFFYEQYLQLRGEAQRSRANAKLRVKIGTFSPYDIYYFLQPSKNVDIFVLFSGAKAINSLTVQKYARCLATLLILGLKTLL